MQVILLERIRNLGTLGEEVRVKSGFARNFLIPYGKAVVANEGNRAQFEARRAELEKTQTDVLSKAQARAAKIGGAKIEIARKMSEDGKLFGSVGIRDVVEAMNAAGFVVEKAELNFDHGPIKDVGDYDFKVSLHPEVIVSVHVSVVGEKSE